MLSLLGTAAVTFGFTSRCDTMFSSVLEAGTMGMPWYLERSGLSEYFLMYIYDAIRRPVLSANNTHIRIDWRSYVPS